MIIIQSIRLTVCFIICLVFSGACFAEQGIFLTDKVQMRVADSFLDEGEYFRAVTEYKRFLIFFPESPMGEYALYRIGIACYLGDEHGDAVRAFNKLAGRYPAGSYLIPARYFEGLSRWKMKDFAGAVEVFKSVAQSSSPSFASRAMAAWSLLELDRGDPSAAAVLLQRFITDFPENLWIAQVKESLSLVVQYEDLPQKSEVFAGILSAILPGAGYVYAGRYGDGLTSLLINGLFIAGTATAVNNDWIPAAGVSGGMGLPFYVGNIYGSANAARKWNRAIRNEMRGRITALLKDVVDENDFSLKRSSDENVPLSSTLSQSGNKETSRVDSAGSFPCFTNISTSDSI